MHAPNNECPCSIQWPAENIGRLADRYQVLPSMLDSRTPEAGSATAASYGAHRTYA
jgi:hypothetical protein